MRRIQVLSYQDISRDVDGTCRVIERRVTGQTDVTHVKDIS